MKKQVPSGRICKYAEHVGSLLQRSLTSFDMPHIKIMCISVRAKRPGRICTTTRRQSGSKEKSIKSYHCRRILHARSGPLVCKPPVVWSDPNDFHLWQLQSCLPGTYQCSRSEWRDTRYRRSRPVYQVYFTNSALSSRHGRLCLHNFPLFVPYTRFISHLKRNSLRCRCCLMLHWDTCYLRDEQLTAFSWTAKA